ncbi:MAG: peroxiredoxin [Chloroflexaceae bacterium]|nr:peroxiredoxin [Chloroflexaceae bacterium]
MLRVGTQAPDFTLEDEQGTQVTLSSFRGQAVVLIFYPGDQTPVCTRQLCGIRDSYDEFTAAGAVVFGINPGSPLSHQKFSQKYDFQFKLLVDRERAAARSYDVLVVSLGPLAVINRAVYVVGSDGTIIFAERGTPANETILAAIRGEPSGA